MRRSVETTWIPITRLRARADNPNTMSASAFRALVEHIRAHERYPALIVRPLLASGDTSEPEYEILDGHHRLEVLRRLHHSEARCEVWQVDDDEAALLLATLNRLRGDDDAVKRAALLANLAERFATTRLARLLPESRARLEKLIALHHATPPDPRASPARATRGASSPDDSSQGEPEATDPDHRRLMHAVTFFLTPRQRRMLDRRLSGQRGSRSARLVALLGLNEESMGPWRGVRP